MSRIVGIDLGTTNSLVAYMEGDQPLVIPNAEGRVIVPSIVSFLETGYLVGDPAKDQLIKNAEKRCIRLSASWDSVSKTCDMNCDTFLTRWPNKMVS